MHHVVFFPAGVDRPAVGRALTEMLRRHDVLRTTFESVDGQPVQIIHPPRDVAPAFIDLTDMADDQRGREWQRLMDRELKQGFDLATGPLHNFVLLQLEPQHYALSVCIHHIVFDDWSVEIFDREFRTCYEDIKAGRPVSLSEVSLQYADFAAAQRDRFDGDDLDQQLSYWRGQLRDLPGPIELPIDKPRPPAQTFPGAIRTMALRPEVARAFRTLTRNANATLFMSLFAAFAVLLHRYCGQRDLVLGTPIANRNRPEVASLIGFMVNTLVLRVDLGDDPSFEDLLGRCRETALGALANQDVPFELLVEELRPDRAANRTPIFQTMFVFQSGLGGKDGIGAKDIASSGAKFDLVLTAIDAAPAVYCELEYNTDLFTQPSMARMAAHLETLIGSIVADPSRRISELAILSPEQRREMVVDWNATASDPPAGCVHEIVDAVAEAQPDAPAVVFEGASLSYDDLARRSDALARRLARLGVAPEAPIGLCLERTPDWIVAMLGVLKAGCAMVPLDPALPAERLAFMIEDAAIGLVLTRACHAENLAGAARLLCLDGLSSEADEPIAVHRAGPDALAYVIYTSGSTGRPKGVGVAHDGLANLALAQGRAWTVNPTSRVLQFASAGFDAAMSEVFSTLCLGGSLYLASREALMPGAPLLEILRDLRITHVTLPPSALAAMQPEPLPDLVVVISAGERLDAGLARRWSQGRRLVNAYGPTEITVCATMHEYAKDIAEVPIGRPIANVAVYVLDRHGEPVPPGVQGEIHVGGVGVARGYLGRPELTAETFIPDHLSGRSGARLYRTGDLGRFDAAGTLSYLGRVDTQLKIRGYRIEPGEIESVLRQHPRVRDALVLGLGSGPRRQADGLCHSGGPRRRSSWSCAASSGAICPSIWRRPPISWSTLGRRRPTARSDQAALAAQESFARDLGTAYVAPATDIEQSIAAIWRGVLGVEQVGATDNFFDLGGHSLLLVRVHDQLKEKLKIELTLVDLFRFPTIKRQTEMLEARTSNRAETETLGHADQRAARQNAARMSRRPRTGTQRHA